MAEKKSNCSLYNCLQRFVIILVVTCILLGTLMLENERNISPQPKAIQYVTGKYAGVLNQTKVTSKSKLNDSKSTTTNSKSSPPPPFNYLWTKSWGKQNEAVFKRVYGDLNCADNPKRNIMIKIMKRWVEIAKKNDIKFTMVFGSLLGVFRNNDVIPWDHDMDVLIEYKDILKLEKVGWPRNIHTWDGDTYLNFIPVSEHKKPGDDRLRWDCQGKPVKTHVDQCAIQEPLVRLYNNRVFLDVFKYDLMKDTVEMFEEGRHTVIQKKDYFPLRRCIFMGFDVWCPNNPENVLKIWYGNDFKTSKKRCMNGHWV